MLSQSWRRWTPALGIVTCCLLASVYAAHAETTFDLTRNVVSAAPYTPGGVVDIQVILNLTTDGTLTALGLEDIAPTGWAFDSVVSGDAPLVQPMAGKDGLLEFAWFPLPAFPVSFTYRLNIPPTAIGSKMIRGQGLCRILDLGEIRTTLIATIIQGEGAGPFHSADVSEDNLISLSELLRVIQFFNMGGYHCAEPPSSTEDGYISGGGGAQACAPHDSDYAPQNWKVSLSELLRLIQFYNSDGYHFSMLEETEDGFFPGQPES